MKYTRHKHIYILVETTRKRTEYEELGSVSDSLFSNSEFGWTPWVPGGPTSPGVNVDLRMEHPQKLQPHANVLWRKTGKIMSTAVYVVERGSTLYKGIGMQKWSRIEKFINFHFRFFFVRRFIQTIRIRKFICYQRQQSYFCQFKRTFTPIFIE